MLASCRIAGLAALFSLYCFPLVGDDWPQWLGPYRDSVWRESGIVAEFPAGGLARKWTVEIGGGYAGPAVAGGRVFVTDFRTQGDTQPDPNRRSELSGTERVLCLDAEDGRPVWSHEYPCTYAISYPAGPRATPTVDGDRVYTLGAEGHLLCLSARDGAVIWQRHLPQEYSAETPMWGYSGHPLVYEDKVITLVGGPGSVAVAFDKNTGKEVWRALSARDIGYCAPTMVRAAGKDQLIIWHAESVNALDPRTGEVYWTVPHEPTYGMAIATPRQLGGNLFLGAIVNQSLLLALSDERPAAEVVWKGLRDRGIDPSFATPFIEEGYIYGVDREGALHCVELATGKRLWSTYEPTTGKERASSGTAFIVKNGERFFLFSETGDLIIAILSPGGYREVSRAHILEPTGDAFGRPVVWSHPAYAQRCVFARNDKELICISLAR